MLKRDARIGIAQLRAVAAGDDWPRLDTVERAVLTSWAMDHANRQWAPALAATLGTVDRGGRYRPAPAPEQPAEPQPKTLAEVSADDAETIAHNAYIAGCLGFIHGMTGGGKTTFMALATAAVTRRGMLFAGQVAKTRPVIVCTEDPLTWRKAVELAGGDLEAVKLCKWDGLPAAIRESATAPAVCVDTMQHAAHEAGSGELDSAIEVDRILRPLSALARATGAAITVLDHEPWSDTDEVKTKKRPRGSGAKAATADFVLHCSAVKDEDNHIESITVEPSDVKGARWGLHVSRLTINLAGCRVDPPGRGGVSGGTAGSGDRPTPAAMLDILHRMPVGDWLSRAKMTGHWSGWKYSEAAGILDSMATADTIEAQVTTTATGERRYRYRLPIGNVHTTKSTPTPTPIGKVQSDQWEQGAERLSADAERLREGAGVAPTPTPIAFSDSPRRGEEKERGGSGLQAESETMGETKAPGGDHPEGGINVTEQEHSEPTTTTTASEQTTEQSDRKPCAWTGRPTTAPEVNLWSIPPASNGGGGDMGAELEWSGAGAVLAGWRPGGPHALTLADIDAILCEDAKWYRATPGYPDAGETVMLPAATAYWRTLTPAEREQERKRMLDSKRAAWRAVHVATMAQPYVDAHEACRAT